MKILTILAFLLVSFSVLGADDKVKSLVVTESDFDCMLDMQAVRGFYVDNLIAGKLWLTISCKPIAVRIFVG